jgi:hypothetical protein
MYTDFYLWSIDSEPAGKNLCKYHVTCYCINEIQNIKKLTSESRSVVDPDEVGSALVIEAGSGSGWTL